MPQVYAVHELATYVRELFDSDPHLGDIWVAGEVSNVSRPASGHVYFTLKDESAQLKCVFFARRFAPQASTARLVQHGAAVLAHGRMSLYEQKGDLQLYVDMVQPEGKGALQAEYERLFALLKEQGLFDDERKRPLPRFPRTIGVVTSPSGAVFQDIRHVLERRWPLAHVVLAPTPVQGLDAVPGIVGGLRALNDRGDVDVIIAGRGGGALEELWPFSDEHVARAIFASAAPVVSAVGHETDTTIADYVADRRAPTPSAAAEIVAPDRADVTLRLAGMATAMTSRLRDGIAAADVGVRGAVHRIERRGPDIDRERQRVDTSARRAQVATEKLHRAAVTGVGGCVWRLRALDPFATLDRGYAIVQRGASVVSSVGDVRAGEALDVRVKDGNFGVVAGTGAIQRKKPRRRVPEAQAPLFTMPEERA